MVMGIRGSKPKDCLQLLEAASARARGARRGLLLPWLCLPPLLLASAVLNLIVNVLCSQWHGPGGNEFAKLSDAQP